MKYWGVEEAVGGVPAEMVVENGEFTKVNVPVPVIVVGVPQLPAHTDPRAVARSSVTKLAAFASPTAITADIDILINRNR